ncbi:MAG: DUF4097 domain-containing protein [Chthoniobacterales bacterium]
MVEAIIEETYPIGADATVWVRNGDGRIYVYGSDANEIKVTALKRAFTKERVDAIKVNVQVDGDSAAIDTIFPPLPQGSLLADRSGTVDYTILVPLSCTLSKIELSNGEIVIEGIRGPRIEATLGKGRVLFSSCFSAARLSVGNGGIDISYPWWEELAFSLDAQTGDGDLRVALPATAALRLEAATATGHIRNRLAEKSKESGDERRLITTIGGPSATEFKLRSTSGNIRIDKAY